MTDAEQPDGVGHLAQHVVFTPAVETGPVLVGVDQHDHFVALLEQMLQRLGIGLDQIGRHAVAAEHGFEFARSHAVLRDGLQLDRSLPDFALVGQTQIEEVGEHHGDRRGATREVGRLSEPVRGAFLDRVVRSTRVGQRAEPVGCFVEHHQLAGPVALHDADHIGQPIAVDIGQAIGGPVELHDGRVGTAIARGVDTRHKLTELAINDDAKCVHHVTILPGRDRSSLDGDGGAGSLHVRLQAQALGQR